MHILALTRLNSLPKKSKENYKENGKNSRNKIYVIFDFTYNVQFLFDLDNR